jgi:hypothetical protein
MISLRQKIRKMSLRFLTTLVMIQSFIVPVLYISCTNDVADNKGLKKALIKYQDYYKKADFMGLAAMAHPDVIELYGTASALAAEFRQLDHNSSLNGIVVHYESFSYHNVESFQKKGNDVIVNIPYQVNIIVNEIPQTMHGVLVAVLHKHRWYVMDEKSRLDLVE